MLYKTSSGNLSRSKKEKFARFKEELYEAYLKEGQEQDAESEANPYDMLTHLIQSSISEGIRSLANSDLFSDSEESDDEEEELIEQPNPKAKISSGSELFVKIILGLGNRSLLMT